jgi:hypothetical protein
MGAGEHVDAVDLVQGEPIEQPPERRPARHRRPRPAEALRGKRDPAGGGKREAVGAARHRARRAEAAAPLKRSSVNDADRLRKYLARFGLDWRAVGADA